MHSGRCERLLRAEQLALLEEALGRKHAESAGCGGVVGQLVAMGFDKKKAAEAVKEVGNDTMECVNWLVVNCA